MLKYPDYAIFKVIFALLEMGLRMETEARRLDDTLSVAQSLLIAGHRVSCLPNDLISDPYFFVPPKLAKEADALSTRFGTCS